MSLGNIEQSSKSKQRVKAKQKNMVAIIFVFIGLFAILTMTVINQPGWAFGLAGALLFLLVILYAREVIHSIKNR